MEDLIFTWANHKNRSESDIYREASFDCWSLVSVTLEAGRHCLSLPSKAKNKSQLPNTLLKSKARYDTAILGHKAAT